MNILYDLNSLEFNSPTVLAIGVFDGVHLGHRFVLSQLKMIAQQNHLKSILMTFSPHPQIFFNRDPQFRLLTTDEEKISILNTLEIDCLLIVPFEAIVNFTYCDFIEMIIYKKLKIKSLVFGYNQKIGKNGDGDYDNVLQCANLYGISVFQTPEMPNSQHISSSAIRKKILIGNVAEANKMLGYRYSFEAMVVEGNRIGRKIGFPTANLKLLNPLKIMPSVGVYAVFVHYQNSTFQGMMNFGKRPTVTNSDELIAEVHIFHFSNDLYQQIIRIEIVEKVRDEIKFANPQELSHQLIKDKEICMNILSQM